MKSFLVETMAATGGEEAGTPAADVSTRHRFPSEALRTYTSR